MSTNFSIEIIHRGGIEFSHAALETLRQAICIDGETAAEEARAYAEGYGSGDVRGRLVAICRGFAPRLSRNLTAYIEDEGAGQTEVRVSPRRPRDRPRRASRPSTAP